MAQTTKRTASTKLPEASEAESLTDEEAELDRLYSAPLDQFVKLRKDLASRLRKEGERAVATRIAELKKPTVSAWVVNQLARDRELDVKRLVKTGEALEQAQREAMSGGGSGGFETARREEAAAVRRLLDAAEKMLPSSSASTLERVAKTLRAAAATPEGRGLVRKGRLAEDLEPPGFEALAGLAGLRSGRKRAAKPASGERRRGQPRIDALEKRKREADENADRTANEAKDLERGAREADQIARKASRAAATARKRADNAAAQARRLKAELDELKGGR